MNAPSSQFAALSRLAQMKEIAAGFVFNSQLQILAREAPERYNDASLRQIAANMLGITSQGDEMGMGIPEFWVRYEHFIVWTKRFGSNLDHYLVIFADRTINVDELRQPLNLAVLNLDRAVSMVEEELNRQAAQNELALRAQAAERALFADTQQDTNQFIARFGVIAERYFGPPYDDTIRMACKECDLTLPIETVENMRKLMTHCASYLKTPVKKEMFALQAEDFVQRFMLAADKPADPKG